MTYAVDIKDHGGDGLGRPLKKSPFRIQDALSKDGT